MQEYVEYTKQFLVSQYFFFILISWRKKSRMLLNMNIVL